MITMLMDKAFFDEFQTRIYATFEDNSKGYYITSFLSRNTNRTIVDMLVNELQFYCRSKYFTIPLADVETEGEAIDSLIRYMYRRLYTYSHIFNLWEIEVNNKYELKYKPNRKVTGSRSGTNSNTKTVNDTTTDKNDRTFDSSSRNENTVNGMGEISPITATLGDITTPNQKSIDKSEGSDTYHSTNGFDGTKTRNISDTDSGSNSEEHTNDIYDIEYVRIQYELATKFNFTDIIESTIRSIIKEFNCYI